MRILQINTRYYNGGSTGRITFDLKKVMEANGIESYVAFGFGYDPKDNEKDLEEISKEITDGMEIVPVERFSQVEKIAFVK